MWHPAGLDVTVDVGVTVGVKFANNVDEGAGVDVGAIVEGVVRHGGNGVARAVVASADGVGVECGVDDLHVAVDVGECHGWC